MGFHITIGLRNALDMDSSESKLKLKRILWKIGLIHRINQVYSVLVG